jgi:hypothetical protein
VAGRLTGGCAGPCCAAALLPRQALLGPAWRGEMDFMAAVQLFGDKGLRCRARSRGDEVSPKSRTGCCIVGGVVVDCAKSRGRELSCADRTGFRFFNRVPLAQEVGMARAYSGIYGSGLALAVLAGGGGSLCAGAGGLRA